MKKLFFLLCSCVFSNSFLFDTSTPGQSGSSLTDDRYDGLLKLFMDERKAMLQLQQYVHQHQQNMTSITERMDKIEASNIRLSNTQGQGIVEMNIKYAKLEQMYNDVQQNNIELRQELNIAKNRSIVLENEIESLKQVKTINQLQMLGSLQQQLQSLHSDVSSLTANNQARSQDLMAIYNEVSENKQKLNSVETYQNILHFNLTTAYKLLEDTLMKMGNDSDTFNKADIGINQTAIQKHIEQTENAIKESGEYVGIMATPVLFPSSNGIVFFNNVKYSYGVSDIASFKNNGKFTCEKHGLYFVIVSIMSCTYNDDTFDIYHNNDIISNTYIGRGTSPSNNGCHSGTGHAIIALYPNDTIYVKISYSSSSFLFQSYSSFAIIKAK